MTNEAKYWALQTELAEIERKTGLYLADQCVDAENADPAFERGSEDYWANMIGCAKCAAGFRAEDAGQDINALIGRVIY